MEPDQTTTRWWIVSQEPADKGGKRRRLTQWSTNSFWPILGFTEQALLRSQQGPMAGLPFTCMPITMESRFQPQELRGFLFLRRLWQPLPLSSFTCRCGRPLDSRGHHRVACPLAGVLGRRGFSLENAAARVCRRQGVGSQQTFESRIWTSSSIKSTPPSVPGCADRHRHHHGVSSPERRDCSTSVRNSQRSSLGPSEEAEGADLPRVVPGWWFWAARWGDGGPKNHAVLGFTCGSQGEV